MSRFIDSFLKLYDIYYKNLYNNLNYFYSIKIKQNQNILTKYFDEFSATDNQYIYDNYCCCCLNPNLNDIFIKMECGHQMHFYCYKKFIKYKYNLCPFCKHELLTNDTSINISNDECNEDIKKNVNFKYEINELYYK
jgi:hypothetical protein